MWRSNKLILPFSDTFITHETETVKCNDRIDTKIDLSVHKIIYLLCMYYICCVVSFDVRKCVFLKFEYPII